MKLIALSALFAVGLFAQTTAAPTTPATPTAPATCAAPVPDSYVAIGATANETAPYNVAAFGSYGMLTNSNCATVPVYAGFGYELYKDSTGKPAYGGMATAKAIVWRSNRFFVFGDASIGGAGSAASISTAFSVGGGGGVIITKSFQIEAEPKAERIPALASGVSGSVRITASYTFNK